MRISKHYGITTPVEFLDVHVHRDNRLYLDPSAIRRASGRHADEARSLLEGHFDQVLACIRGGDSAAGLELLRHYNELNLTRLGMSRGVPRGRGAADRLGQYLWEELSGNPLCAVNVAVLKRVEDIPLFVHGIGKDITSDATARIILSALGAFTAEMLQKYPEFSSGGHALSTVSHRCWDRQTSTWSRPTFDVPAPNGEPLMLIPSDWVYFKLIQRPDQYYASPILGQVREEETRYVPGRRGKPRLVRPTKKDLRSRPGLKYSRETNTRRTLEVFETHGRDLVEEYRSLVDENTIDLSATQLEKYLERE